MGITPTYPSEKYGYIVPQQGPADQAGAYPVARFTEKPDAATAERLLAENACWNGGVFAFRLGHLMKIVDKYMPGKSFAEIHADYEQFPKISFDYEVVEKAQSVAVVPYAGEWRDLGTWNTLTEKLPASTSGNAALHQSENTHIVNELGIPVIGLGLKDLIIVVSPEGILVSDKSSSEQLKSLLK